MFTCHPRIAHEAADESLGGSILGDNREIQHLLCWNLTAKDEVVIDSIVATETATKPPFILVILPTPREALRDKPPAM